MTSILHLPNESKLNSLPFNLNFIQKEKILTDGFTATDDYHKNTCRALSVLGSSCVGHSGTTHGEPGFYYVIANRELIKEFLLCKTEISAPRYRKLCNILYFMEKDFIELCKSFIEIDFKKYYYFILYQIQNDNTDVRMKQIPRSASVLLKGEIDSSILKPYIENYINDDYNIKKLFEIVNQIYK